MSDFLNLTIAGITSGAITGVLAAYLAIWFRVSGILNLAVGDFAVIGALGVADLVDNEHMPFALAAILMLAAAGALGWVFDRLVLHFAFDRRPRDSDHIVSIFFYTFGLSLLLEGVGSAIFGQDVQATPEIWSGPPVHLGGVNIPHAAILVIGLAVLSGVLLWAYLRFTVSGAAATACGENPLGAQVVGIKPAAFRRRVLVATVVLAALFGIVESPLTGFTYSSGASISIIGVVAAGFAAFRRPGRAVAIGVGIGLAEAFIGGYINATYNDVILYAALFAMIVIRPQMLGLARTA